MNLFKRRYKPTTESMPISKSLTFPSSDIFLRHGLMRHDKSFTSSVVFACMNYLSKGLAEPVVATDEGTKLNQMLKNLPEELTPNQLIATTGLHITMEGKAVWIIHRNRIYLMPMFSVSFDETSKIFTTPLGPKRANDVVVFRLMPKIGSPYEGYSALEPMREEIATDIDLRTFLRCITRGIPAISAIIMPDDDSELDQTQLDDMLTHVSNTFGWRGNDHRGGILGLTRKVKFEKVSMTPEDMDIEGMRQTPEDRICACFGISPLVIGLGSGLNRSTFSNMQEAHKAAVNHALSPIWSCIESTVNLILVPKIEDTGTMRLETSAVRALRADETSKRESACALVTHGIISITEARRDLGYSEIVDGELLTDTSVIRAG